MNDIYYNIMPGWKSVIPVHELTQAINNIVSLEGKSWRDSITPPPHLIMEAFRYKRPEEIKVVIIGQDPYPTPNQAQGLSFSVPKGQVIPSSLRNILQALAKSKLRSHGPISHGDLKIWAIQGVLLLNISLTTRLNTCRAHIKIWKNFIDKFLKDFCDFRQSKYKSSPILHFLLWGNDARKYSSMIRNFGHAVHEWTQPSDLTDAQLPLNHKFEFCPHFVEVNDALQVAKAGIINWDPLAQIIGFTDGACTKNGRKNARGAFAVVLVGIRFNGILRETIIQGKVAPFQYGLISDDPNEGFKPTNIPALPTNNRAELLAICWCLFVMFKARLRSRLHLVSDSRISLMTLQEWLPKRRLAGQENNLKNTDLLFIADMYYQKLLESAYSIKMHQVRAHQPPPPPKSSAWDKLLYRGNFRADEIATGVLNRNLAIFSQQEKVSPIFESISVSNAPSILENFLGIHDPKS